MIAKKGLRVYTKPINILTNNNNNNMETRNVEIKDPETAKRFIGGRNVEIKDPKNAKWFICGPITGYDVEERRKEFERAVLTTTNKKGWTWSRNLTSSTAFLESRHVFYATCLQSAAGAA